MNRSKIIQAYEARHARPTSAKSEELPTPPKYVFMNDDCDAFNAIRIFDAELRNKLTPKLTDWIDAREEVYRSFEATTSYADSSVMVMEFKDGSQLYIDIDRKFFRLLRLA